MNAALSTAYTPPNEAHMIRISAGIFLLAALATMVFAEPPATSIKPSPTVDASRPVPADAAAPRPVTGQASTQFVAFDARMQESMDRIGATSSTLAITRKGQVFYSRGYGWQDQKKTHPTEPDELLRIASCTKPITAAAIAALVREKKIDPQAKVFDYLSIKPAGEWGDARLREITIQQLLEHRGGWDRDQSYDPMFKLTRIEKALKLTSRAQPQEIVQYMLAQPLQFAPGERRSYSNLGYIVLGRVIERATGKSYYDGLESLVMRPFKIKEIQLARDLAANRPASEVEYPGAGQDYWVEPLDACGGLIASAPALCQFMQHYWLSGARREPNSRGEYYFFGSLPGTTALMLQRNDEYCVAALFNARRDDHYEKDNELIKQSLTETLEAIIK